MYVKYENQIYIVIEKKKYLYDRRGSNTIFYVIIHEKS